MRAFKQGTIWTFPQGASEWPEVKVLALQIHLIKQDFSRTFRFDFWQFWYPLKKKFMQYLIWKLSLVVRNLGVGKGVAALLHSTIQSWRVPVLLHTESKERFWGITAVYIFSRDMLSFNHFWAWIAGVRALFPSKQQSHLPLMEFKWGGGWGVPTS